MNQGQVSLGYVVRPEEKKGINLYVSGGVWHP